MAKKIVEQPILVTEGKQRIGLDIGYGLIKAIMQSATVSFPSVAGVAREVKFRADELAIKYPGDQISDDEGSWFIGDLAISQLKSGALNRLRGRTANADVGNLWRLRFAKVAIGKLFPNKRNGEVIHISIATGLPVDHMRDAAALKATLIGQHHIHTDQTDFVANITEVMVMPQPYGTIYSKMLTPKGDLDPCHTATRTGVVDIGTYTVDVAVDDDGEYIDAESGSVEYGMSSAQDLIADAFERDHGEKPRYKQIETILRTGCVKVGGQPYNYREEVDQALSPLHNVVLTLMNDKWQSGKALDVIYVAGGGAEPNIKSISAAGYKQSQMVDDPQFANARGYRNYAEYSAKE